MESKNNNRTESTSSTESISLINETLTKEKNNPMYNNWTSTQTLIKDLMYADSKSYNKQRKDSIDSQEKTPRINIIKNENRRIKNTEIILENNIQRKVTPTKETIEKVLNKTNVCI